MADKKYEHLLKIGYAIGLAMKEVHKSERSDIYQTIIRHIPWHEVRKHVAQRSKEGTQAWAVIWPDGRVLVDSTFRDEAHAWTVALGWPDAEEIAEAKKKGVKVKKIFVDLTN